MGLWRAPTRNQKRGYAMKKDTVVALHTPAESFADPLTELLQHGAKQLLHQAVESELAALLAQYQDEVDQRGHRQIVRNGFLPERTVQTGVGPVSVRVPRVRDRRDIPAEEKVRFSSAILPPYLRRSRSLEELIPWLYLKGVSTGDFSEALSALLGPDAPGLSAATISRLKASWMEDFKAWQSRDLTGKRYVYFWADGVYLTPRMDDRQCLLVIIGATETGKKELVAIESGFRESEHSWTDVLLDLKKQGLKECPKVAVGDGALGFWKAIGKVFGKTRWQRCWVHKTANILSKLPKSEQKKAKERIHEIWMAATKENAEKAFDFFLKAYEAKYEKATECLKKDREELLTFYDFPAEHWKHLRTSNPIESTFATVKLRTAKPVAACHEIRA